MRYLILLLAVLMVGCNPCKDETCLNGVKEEDGSDCKCKCDRWYSGDECQKAYNSDKGGTYIGDLDCPNGRERVKFIVKPKESSPDRILFEGLGVNGNFLAENGDFEIPKQDVTKSDDFQSVSGNGNIDGEDIEMVLTITLNNGEQSNCTFIGRK